VLSLLVRDPRRDGNGKQFHFDGGFTIGRAPGNAMLLLDPTIQPAHAEVVVEGDTHWLVHAGSRVALRVGDHLTLGPYEITVVRADTISRLAQKRAEAARAAQAAQTARVASLHEMEFERARRAVPRTPFVARSKIEAALLRELRANPQDDATLEVYADYLDEHGEPDQAALARLALRPALDDEAGATQRSLARPRDAMWRAVVTRPPIDRCLKFDYECPERWDRLTPTAQDDVRHCGVCNRQVVFCTSLERAYELGAQRACIAIDATMTREQACSSYDDAAHPIRMGRPPSR
jgi:uncharacterized protein (TIGR02996 family)